MKLRRPRVRRALLATGSVVVAMSVSGCCDALPFLCPVLDPNLTADKQQVEPGGTVKFTSDTKWLSRPPFPLAQASGLDLPDAGDPASIDLIAWDYDGDEQADDEFRAPPGEDGFLGVFSDRPRLPSHQEASHPYPTAGLFQPAVMVARGDFMAIDRLNLRVGNPEPTVPGNQPPTASFTATRETRGDVGWTFFFNATESKDPDGRISTYRWSFGDNDAAESGEPTIRHEYAGEGFRTVTLTVIDEKGAASQSVTQEIYLPPAGGSGTIPSAAAAQSARPRPFNAVLSGFAGLKPQKLRRRGRLLQRKGTPGRGRLRAQLPGRRRRTDALVRSLLRGRWRMLMNTSFDPRRFTGQMTGWALVTPRGRRGRACVTLRVRAGAFGNPTGSLRLRGGTGRFARLRLTANFSATGVRAGSARIAGTVQARRGARRGIGSSCTTRRR